MRTIVWFRGKDLRVADHVPLRDAAAGGDAIPLFVLDPYFFAPDRARELPHRIQFLLDSLLALEASLAARGSRLVVVAGRSLDVVPRLFRDWKADRIVAHRWVEPVGRERDRRIGEALGGRLELSEGETLLPPGVLRTGAGRPYSVFTRFARAFADRYVPARPLAAPRALPSLPRGLRVVSARIPSCADLGLPRNPAILEGGEAEGHARLRGFLRSGLDSYHRRRDRMDLPGTSRLSADLKFGTLSVRQVWNAVEAAGGGSAGARCFQNELLWREFAYSSLWDRPDLLERPFREAFTGFPWARDEKSWRAWAEGRTGYPVVDAAARQLLHEGFVHNRARMIAASFLSKHLLLDWRRGEAHYLKHLTDGDWANNDLGWQWSAGCGCDAQPWFRIFNPVAQGEKLDPCGDYVRRWVPELEGLPPQFIHRPWEAPGPVLSRAGVRLGATYPLPIVDLRLARERFLATARQHLKGDARPPRRPCLFVMARYDPGSQPSHFSLETGRKSTPMAAKSKRTTHRSSKGKKLYAVRTATGKFSDIQTYERAHSADLRKKSKAETTTTAKKGKKK